MNNIIIVKIKLIFLKMWHSLVITEQTFVGKQVEALDKCISKLKIEARNLEAR